METMVSALKIGYRHLDTASLYDNEEEVGEAIRRCGLPRDEIPAYDDVEHRLQAIFESHEEQGGIVLRHCRYLWKAVIT